MLQRIFCDVLGMSLISDEFPLMMHKTGLSTWKRWMTHKATCNITIRIRTATFTTNEPLQNFSLFKSLCIRDYSRELFTSNYFVATMDEFLWKPSIVIQKQAVIVKSVNQSERRYWEPITVCSFISQYEAFIGTDDARNFSYRKLSLAESLAYNKSKDQWAWWEPLEQKSL